MKTIVQLEDERHKLIDELARLNKKRAEVTVNIDNLTRTIMSRIIHGKD